MAELAIASGIAGLTLPYNNGPTGYAVDRTKMIKRGMYDCANVDILRKRVLLQSRSKMSQTGKIYEEGARTPCADAPQLHVRGFATSLSAGLVP